MATVDEVLRELMNEVEKLKAVVNTIGRTSPTGYMSSGIVRDVTVSGGVLTCGAAHYAVTPETGNTDNVDTVNVGRGGRKITFRIKTPGDTITFKDGIDNLNLSGGDVVLDDVDKYLTIIYDDENDEWKIYAKGF
jgi:hypothetical protein